MESREQHSPEAARQRGIAELTESGANPPEGFSTLEESVSNLLCKRAGGVHGVVARA